MNKTWSFFKLSAMTLMTISLFTFAACEDSEDETTTISNQEFAEKFFTVNHGTYHSEEMPASTSSIQLSDVTVSGTAKAGGTTTIFISSNVECERFFIGADGTNGYIEYVPGTRAGGYTYNIPVSFGNVTSETMEVIIKAQTADGNITQAYRQPVSFNNFGIDIGINNISEVQGKWMCEYINDEYEVDGDVYRDYVRCIVNFSSANGRKTAEYTMEEYTLDEKGGKWDGSWHWQSEGTAKVTGSTLHLYTKKVRARTFDGDWCDWTDKGSALGISPFVDEWKNYENTWSEYVENQLGNMWECLVGDTHKYMQWRAIKSVVEENATITYNYDPDVAIRQFVKQ